jgi:UDP-2,4-diacetamido-2,4,6-trideoxy-beta-L-altropyranose hydrolase
MNLLIRCDASVAMGTGHAMRCLALAESWQDEGGHAVFAMAEATPAVEERLRQSGADVVRLEATAGSDADSVLTRECAARVGGKACVVDGYQFDAAYQAQIKNAGLKQLFVDDNAHASYYCADWVLNQNAHATAALYPNRESSTRLLLGPRYALLRREFGGYRRWQRQVPQAARQVLVSLGGSDPNNAALRVVEALGMLPERELRTTVVVGGSSPHRTSLEQAAAGAGSRIAFVQNVSNMPELMAAADAAVLSSSSTALEACFLGLPALLLELAPNQHALGEALHRAGAACFLGCAEDVSPAVVQRALCDLGADSHLRQQMSERGRQLVDGHGSERVTALLQDRIRLRRAVESDCTLLFDWANDRGVRAASFSSAPVAWDEHQRWFTARMQDPHSLIFVAEEKGTPVGAIRFALEGERATLSISVSPEARGQGRGRVLLLLGIEALFQSSQVAALDAFVKPANTRSLELFDQAGFQRSETATVRGQAAIHFVMRREVRG